MDGNGRWAGQHGLPRTAGHTEGEENLARIVRLAVPRDIGWLTVFGFSTENWIRPRAEVRHILGLHEKLFGRINELNELNVRIQWIGRPFDSADGAHPEVRAAGDPQGDRRHRRQHWNGVDRGLRLRQPSRADVGGHRRPCAGPVTPASIVANLYLPELPPVDVMVRTSGERRVSNFLLWQGAGAEDPLHRQRLARLRRRRSRRRDRARSMTHDDAASAVTPSIAALDAVTAALPVSELRNGQRRWRKAVAEAIESAVVIWWFRRARAPARRSPTSFRRSSPASARSSPPPPRRSRTSSPPRTSRSSSSELAEHGIDADWAVLKGRSNYLCLQRLREFTRPGSGHSSSSSRCR